MAGSTYSAFYLANGLHQRGHDVWVGYKKGSFLEKLIEGADFEKIEFNPNHKLDFKAAKQLATFVQVNQIDVVNAQASVDRHITIFARWFFGMPGKLLHTRRQKPQSVGGWLKAWFYTKGTDKIIAVSPAIKNFLINSGIPGHHIQVITNGIPESKWKSIDPLKVDALRKKYGINDEDLVIGCVSRIKKQDQILKAIQKIDKPTRVLFVGIVDQFPHLSELIKSLPSKHEVFFTGEISNEEVLQHYPLFTMKILPSDMEGFSQSILEAMALGVPVIATNASGNPNLIEDGVNGLLFEDGDIDQLSCLINKLEGDDPLRKDIIKNAWERVKNRFGLDEMILKYEKLFG